MIRRQLLPILVPVVVIGGYIVTIGIGGVVEYLWQDYAGPFLFTYWVGLGFTIAWDVATVQINATSPAALAVTGVLGSAAVLMMLGGPTVLMEDPWLFGVAIAPGLRLVGPWIEGRSGDQRPRMQ